MQTLGVSDASFRQRFAQSHLGVPSANTVSMSIVTEATMLPAPRSWVQNAQQQQCILSPFSSVATAEASDTSPRTNQTAQHSASSRPPCSRVDVVWNECSVAANMPDETHSAHHPRSALLNGIVSLFTPGTSSVLVPLINVAVIALLVTLCTVAFLAGGWMAVHCGVMAVLAVCFAASVNWYVRLRARQSFTPLSCLAAAGLRMNCRTPRPRPGTLMPGIPRSHSSSHACCLRWWN